MHRFDSDANFGQQSAEIPVKVKEKGQNLAKKCGVTWISMCRGSSTNFSTKIVSESENYRRINGDLTEI